MTFIHGSIHSELLSFNNSTIIRTLKSPKIVPMHNQFLISIHFSQASSNTQNGLINLLHKLSCSQHFRVRFITYFRSHKRLLTLEPASL